MTSPVIATKIGFIALGGGTNNVAHGFTVIANDYIVIATTNLLADAMSVTGYAALGTAFNNGRVSLFGLKMTGGETTIPIVEDPSAHQCYIAWQCRGQHLTTPEDAAAVAVNGQTGTLNGGSITTANNNSWVFNVAIGESTGLTPTAPSGYGDLLFKERDTSPNHTVMGAIKQVAVAGAEDPAAFGSAAVDGATITWAMRPAAGGATIVCTPLNGLIVRGARRIGRVVAGAAIAIPTLHQVLHYGSRVI